MYKLQQYIPFSCLSLLPADIQAQVYKPEQLAFFLTCKQPKKRTSPHGIPGLDDPDFKTPCKLSTLHKTLANHQTQLAAAIQIESPSIFQLTNGLQTPQDPNETIKKPTITLTNSTKTQDKPPKRRPRPQPISHTHDLLAVLQPKLARKIKRQNKVLQRIDGRTLEQMWAEYAQIRHEASVRKNNLQNRLADEQKKTTEIIHSDLLSEHPKHNFNSSPLLLYADFCSNVPFFEDISGHRPHADSLFLDQSQVSGNSHAAQGQQVSPQNMCVQTNDYFGWSRYSRGEGYGTEGVNKDTQTLDYNVDEFAKSDTPLINPQWQI